MIVTQGLTRTFGPVTAVEDLTLTIDDGEVFGLLGPNGAGKTTTLRMLAGLIGVTSGTAIVHGHDIRDPQQAERVRALLGLLPEENGLASDLTPRQTLDFYARLHHVRDRRHRVDALLERLSLQDKRDASVATLSKGMKQRLAIARALVNEPQLVLLDEPTANLDPQSSQEVREVILELRGRGCTVIVNTHRLEEAERTCDRIGILRRRLLRVADPRRIPQQQEVVRVELESSHDTVLWAMSRMAHVEADGEALLVTLPRDRSVHDLVTTIVAAGGRIVSIVPQRPSLERLYREVMQGAH